MFTHHPFRALAVPAVALFAAPSVVDSTEPPASSSPAAAAEPVEVDTPLARLAVGSADTPELLFIDLDDTEVRHTVSLPQPAGYASALTSDSRYVLAAHPDAVTVVDGAAWTEPHGDHSHSFAGAPRLVGTVEGDHPSHLISHDGVTALWFDGTGSAQLFDEAGFAPGPLQSTGTLPTAAPHHGFAVPVGEHFVTTVPSGETGDLPDVVAVTDDAGTILAEHECTDAHGETSWAVPGAAVAVACADGVLVLSTGASGWVADRIAYPTSDDTDPFGQGPARAWALEAGDDGETIVAPFGSRHVLRVDTHEGSAELIDIGAQIAVFGLARHEASGDTLVLTVDGAVHVLDDASGELQTTPDVLAPFTEGDGTDIYRAIVVAGDRAFVSDPDHQAVVEVSIADGAASVAGNLDVGFAPSFVAAVNG